MVLDHVADLKQNTGRATGLGLMIPTAPPKMHKTKTAHKPAN